jgi:hypothetical protein
MPHEPYTSFEQWADEKQELELEVRPRLPTNGPF